MKYYIIHTKNKGLLSIQGTLDEQKNTLYTNDGDQIPRREYLLFYDGYDDLGMYYLTQDLYEEGSIRIFPSPMDKVWWKLYFESGKFVERVNSKIGIYENSSISLTDFPYSLSETLQTEKPCKMVLTFEDRVPLTVDLKGTSIISRQVIYFPMMEKTHEQITAYMEYL